MLGTAQAFEVAVEFSAQAIQQAPMRPDYQATMYVTKEAVRTESKINNIPVVEVLNIKQQTRVLLIEKNKIYLKQNYAHRSNLIAGGAGHQPCKGMPDTTCKKITEEIINGRKTEKWEFTVKRHGQQYRSLHWIDVVRRMPVREFFPDGTVTESKFIGQERLQGRHTEKWSITMTRADGQSITSLQWYDPELKMAIREQMQGGFIRELRDIKLGKQQSRLFQIPADYTEVQQLPEYLLPKQVESHAGY